MRNLVKVVIASGLLLLLPVVGTAQTSPQASIQQLQLENKALIDALQIQGDILSESVSFSAQASSSDKGKTTREKFDSADKKAREGGYHREYHESVKKYGGERLKEEFRNWCNNRPLNQREVNC